MAPLVDPPGRLCYNGAVPVATSGQIILKKLVSSVRSSLTQPIASCGTLLTFAVRSAHSPARSCPNRALITFAALRLQSSATKVSALRPLGHAVIAYAAAGGQRWPLLLWNTLLLGALLVGLSLIDDYRDWRDTGEANSFARLSFTTSRTSRWLGGLLALCVLCTLPWFVAVISRQIPLIAVELTGLGTVLVASYTLPPLRLKAHPRVSLWIAPLAAGLLFAEAYTVLRPPSALMLALAVWCMGLQLHAELLHILDDEPTPGVPAKLSRSAARRWLRYTQLVLAGYAALSMVRWPLAFLSVCCALTRFIVCRQISQEQLHRWRRQLWHPIWSLYDLAIYAALGVMNGGLR